MRMSQRRLHQSELKTYEREIRKGVERRAKHGGSRLPLARKTGGKALRYSEQR